MTKRELIDALKDVRDHDHIEIQMLELDDVGETVGYTWYEIKFVDTGFLEGHKNDIDYVPVFLTIGDVTGNG